MESTVDDLIEELLALKRAGWGCAVVRVAYQPSWPLVGELVGVAREDAVPQREGLPPAREVLILAGVHPEDRRSPYAPGSAFEACERPARSYRPRPVDGEGECECGLPAGCCPREDGSTAGPEADPAYPAEEFDFGDPLDTVPVAAGLVRSLAYALDEHVNGPGGSSDLLEAAVPLLMAALGDK